MALMPIDEAVEAALSTVTPAEVERGPVIPDGRFLAEPLRAPRDLPGCDNSAMDGYAVHARDTAGASRDRPARLRVTGTAYAGDAPLPPIGPGTAIRIFTGAAIPPGADAVVRQEATVPCEGFVDVVVEARPGEHVRRRGEELPVGALVFVPGARVDAYVSGVLASLGFAQVATYRRPRVFVLAIGDELLPPGALALPHQVYASNGPLIAGLSLAAGAELAGTALARDELAPLQAELNRALEAADVLITTGGASVGDRDHVKQALRALGATFAVDGVALKPGKPAAIATLAGKHVAVLPGNPGAAAVAFDRLVRPLLLARQGAVEVRRTVRARLDTPRKKQPGLTWFLSARLEDRDGELWARVRPQGAGQLYGNVGLDGWVVLPRGRGEFQAGERVELELLGASSFVGFVARRRQQGAHAGPGDGPAAATWLPAVSVVGWSDTGKTTLIERLLVELERRGIRAAVAKHTVHAHPLHKPGSDTALFDRDGARAVAFITPDGAQVTWHPGSVTEALRALLHTGGARLVLVEGWKDGPLPKVLLRRPGAPSEELNVSPLIATVDDPNAADTAAIADAILAATTSSSR